MLQGGGVRRTAPEPLPRGLVAQRGRQHLDRHSVAEGLADGAETAPMPPSLIGATNRD